MKVMIGPGKNKSYLKSLWIGTFWQLFLIPGELMRFVVKPLFYALVGIVGIIIGKVLGLIFAIFGRAHLYDEVNDEFK